MLVHTALNLAVAAAYFAIPLWLHVHRTLETRRVLPVLPHRWEAFILVCGFGHLAVALTNIVPAYYVETAVLASVAATSWWTVFGLFAWHRRGGAAAGRPGTPIESNESED